MSDGYPSMTALLGLLALAGYQNKDKLAELLGGCRTGGALAPGGTPTASGGAGGGLGASWVASSSTSAPRPLAGS